MDGPARILEQAWEISGVRQAHSLAIRDALDVVLTSRLKSYRYAVLTALLAKRTDPTKNPQVLQRKSKLPGAYDARSFCKQHVVPFETGKGDLWGMSADPYVSNPLRRPEMVADDPQAKDRRAHLAAFQVAQWAKAATEEDLLEGLVVLMRSGRERLASRVMPEPTRAVVRLLAELDTAVRAFVSTSDGGTRLQAVVAAIVRLARPGSDIRVGHVNAADAASGAAGDVQTWSGGAMLASVEVRDRPVDDVALQASITKAARANVRELVVVTGPGIPAPADPAAAPPRLDLAIMEIDEVLRAWLPLLGPAGRDALPGAIHVVLQEMRREDLGQAWDDALRQATLASR